MINHIQYVYKSLSLFVSKMPTHRDTTLRSVHLFGPFTCMKIDYGSFQFCIASKPTTLRLARVLISSGAFIRRGQQSGGRWKGCPILIRHEVFNYFHVIT